MAKVIQVVLMKSSSYTDSRRKFKRNVPVTLSEKEAEKYRGNALFSVREVEESRVGDGLGTRKANSGDPFKGAVHEETTRLPQRKKKTGKKLTPKQGE